MTKADFPIKQVLKQDSVLDEWGLLLEYLHDTDKSGVGQQV